MNFKNIQEEIKILETLPDERLAEISNELNSWGWPKELPNPEEPPNTKDFDSFRACRRSTIIEWIENKLGKKFILRIHNKKMTDEEFETFWNEWGSAARR